MLEDGKILIGKSAKPEYLTPEARQPPRPRHRRDRHRQDRDPAGAGRGLLERRRAGVRRRHQGRPVGRRRSRATASRPSSSGRRRSASNTRRTAFPWCSGTCSASRAIRSAPPSPRWGRCCSPACSSSTTCRRACSTSPSGSPTTQNLPLLDLKDLRALLNFVAENADDRQRQVRQRRQGLGRRDPAPAARAREPGRRQVLRRAGARTCRTSCGPTATAAASSTSWPPTS